ncbi:Transposon Ty3-G Gag-Pol poly [Paramuricea clavata]|uniref:Transposon Ty3-G Gag-Pol poly n=3 Tax=Paramuricea clavata TaxID=317549 RepID=A0A7D9J419_PARCT|nr:Transposon Ty3-G Gag-Pol poly [Paramuricea clavata]
MDDIIIYGSTPQEHDQRLEATMKAVKEVGLKLQKAKCEVGVQQLTYLGDTISAEGLKPDQRKVEAIQNMERPGNKTDLQRFLGMINYLARYIPDLSTRTMPLRKLLDQKVLWMWDNEQEKAWKELKELVSSEPVLKFYDPNKPIKISTDASRSGLGAVLQQLHGENWLPVAYASRSVTDCESRYATIELETLGMTFSCERFHQYIYGQEFEIETDHKPLVSIFKKSLIDSPPRIQRLRLRLQKYDFKLSYVPGKWMHTPDALSRAPLKLASKSDHHIEAHVDGIIAVLQVTDEKLKEIKEETQKDKTMISLQNTIMQGWPNERPNTSNELHAYWNIRDELSVHQGLILKGSKIVIPTKMRKEILIKIHAGHQGREKCKQRARQVVFWPGINSDIDNIVESCETCQHHQHNHQKEPLKPYPVPTRPWQVVGTDLCEINKKEYLVIVDAYSSYPEVIPLSSQSSKAVIKGMKVTFARHGIPDIVHSDNGPCYSSQEFADFKTKWGFKHVTSSPHFPSSNGLVEKAVQTVKNIISKSIESGTDPYLGLLAYRSTPLDNHKSPAELLMGRTLKTDLPVVENQLNVKDSKAVVAWKTKKKEIQKAYHDREAKPLPPLKQGEMVRIYDQKKLMWGEKATVKEKIAIRSYIVETKDKVQYRRNRKQLRKITSEVEDGNDKNVSTTKRAEKQVETKSLPSNEVSRDRSRYGRTIKKPRRYEQYT